MGARSQVLYTTGASGSGKTLRRGAWFVCKELLVQSDAIHVSNFPWKFEPWTDGADIQREGLVGYMGRRGMAEDEVRRRVIRIDDETTNGWRNDGWKEGDPIRGPWDTFAAEDMSGWHLAIDEIHNYCPKAGAGCRRIQAAWSKWLGELRHRGATIEFLSQSPNKVAGAIENEAEIRLELAGNAQRPDPFLGVKMYYWYQLQAKLTGVYRPSCWQQELRQVGGKWKVQEASPFWFDDELFGVYDTWSAPIAGGIKGTTGKQPYQLYSWPRLLAWFWMMNAWPLTWRPAVGAALLAGLLYRHEVMSGYFEGMKSIASGAGQGTASSSPAAGVSAPPAVVGSEKMTSNLDRERILFLEDELDESKGALAAKSAELMALQNKMEAAFAVASVTPTQVTFRGGYTYAVGDLVDFGPYEGQAVAGIDFPRRLVALSDGRRLRMGVDGGASWLQSAVGQADKAVAAAGVPGALPSAGIRAATEAGRSVIVAKRDPERKRDAPRPVRSVVGERDGGVDRSGVESGPGAGERRGQGPVSR